MLFTSLVSQARALCRARGKSGRAGRAARNRPSARRATFERLEAREVLSSFNPVPGVVVTSIGAATSDRAFASFLDSDRKIVVAGDTWALDKYGVRRDNFAVLGYQADGVLDPGFGTGGVVTTTFQSQGKPTVALPSHAYGVAAYSGGRILAAGSSRYYPGTDLALARYNSNGSLDNTFNLQGTGKKATYGTVQTDLGGSDRINGVVVQPDGKIVAAGTTDASGRRQFTLARYTAAGRLDATFGAGGVVTTPDPDVHDLWAVTLHQGKILAVGWTGYPVEGGEDFALARYNLDGTLDTTFGTGGKVVTDHRLYDQLYAVAVYPSGSPYQDYIVVAGETAGPDSTVGVLAVARYRPDGSLDPGFGSGGIVETPGVDFGTYANVLTEAKAVALQPDGSIVAAGRQLLWDPAASVYHSFLFLARYDTLGNLDPTFGCGGIVATQIPNMEQRAFVQSVLIQPQLDGTSKIVAAGYAEDVRNRDYIALARYNPDGSLDGTFGVSGAAGASAASPAALTDAALADAGRQQLALAALLQYEDQLQAKPAARSKGLEVPAVDLALLDLAS